MFASIGTPCLPLRAWADLAPPPLGDPAARGYHVRMHILAQGIDMVDCDRLSALIDRHGRRFLERVFTLAERDYCSARKHPTPHLAGRFAVKEAVLKVLGTGWRDGIAWTDIETRNQPSGQPTVHLTGRCRQLAQQQGLTRILVSISHIRTHAVASAIGLGET